MRPKRTDGLLHSPRRGRILASQLREHPTGENRLDTAINENQTALEFEGEGL